MDLGACLDTLVMCFAVLLHKTDQVPEPAGDLVKQVPYLHSSRNSSGAGQSSSMRPSRFPRLVSPCSWRYRRQGSTRNLFTGTWALAIRKTRKTDTSCPISPFGTSASGENCLVRTCLVAVLHLCIQILQSTRTLRMWIRRNHERLQLATRVFRTVVEPRCLNLKLLGEVNYLSKTEGNLLRAARPNCERSEGSRSAGVTTACQKPSRRTLCKLLFHGQAHADARFATVEVRAIGIERACSRRAATICWQQVYERTLAVVLTWRPFELAVTASFCYGCNESARRDF